MISLLGYKFRKYIKKKFFINKFFLKTLEFYIIYAKKKKYFLFFIKLQRRIY